MKFVDHMALHGVLCNFKMSARKYLSGAAKRKLKKQGIVKDAKHRRTLEDFEWKQSSIMETNLHCATGMLYYNVLLQYKQSLQSNYTAVYL